MQRGPWPPALGAAGAGAGAASRPRPLQIPRLRPWVPLRAAPGCFPVLSESGVRCLWLLVLLPTARPRSRLTVAEVKLPKQTAAARSPLPAGVCAPRALAALSRTTSGLPAGLGVTAR